MDFPVVAPTLGFAAPDPVGMFEGGTTSFKLDGVVLLLIVLRDSLPPRTVLDSLPPRTVLDSLPPRTVLDSLPPRTVLDSLPPRTVLDSLPLRTVVVFSVFRSSL